MTVNYNLIKSDCIYTITNWRVSLSKICHEWPNNTVTHECVQRMSELQRYLVMSDIFLIMKLVNLPVWNVKIRRYLASCTLQFGSNLTKIIFQGKHFNYFIVVGGWRHFFEAIHNTITNRRVSLSKICHEWPNNVVTHECAQRYLVIRDRELQRYLVICDIFLIMKLVNYIYVNKMYTEIYNIITFDIIYQENNICNIFWDSWRDNFSLVHNLWSFFLWTKNL
jgi:hypothetical protein